MSESKSIFRVYYEDTDMGGVVYHANYLKYLERGRTEFFRNKGFCLFEFMTNEGLHFVVKNINISFNKPARLGDELIVTTKLSKLGKAKLSFEQYIEITTDSDKRLCEAEVLVGCLDKGFKPSRIPEHMRKEL